MVSDDQQQQPQDYWQDLPGTLAQASTLAAIQAVARLETPPPLSRIQALLDKTPKYEGVPRSGRDNFQIRPYQDLSGAVMAKLAAAMDLAVAHAEGKISSERYFATSLALTRSAYEDARTMKRSEVAKGQAKYLERRSDAESDGLFTDAERQKLEKPQQRGRQRQRNNYNFRNRSRSRSRSRSAPRQQQQQQPRTGNLGRQRQARSQPPRRGE